MSIIDIIFVFFGALLIFAGLYLFVSGKKDTSNNHVEGFGIKLNVSNPAIILILSGIGLLVLPRFMPEDNSKTTPTNLASPPTLVSQANKTEIDDSNSETILSNKKEISEALPAKIEQNPVYFPANSWQLNSYQENNIEFNVPLQVNAIITFSNRSATQVHWTTEVFVVDVNGNVSSNGYNGRISYINNGYTISFLGSTALVFEPELSIPLELKIENGGILHMSYTSISGEELVHWQQ